MHSITGYHITEYLHESLTSLVYRATREADQHNVILKILKERYPSPERIAKFQREYVVTHSLNIPGTIQVYQLDVIQDHWTMVLEDFGGYSLAHLNLAGSLDLRHFLELAIWLAKHLGDIHRTHVIHKDINPGNMVYNPRTRQIKLIDFGIATVLSRETTTFHNPNVLEGTLAYMAPEQTGRMNRDIDYRTDFYSLGVTFYELLTGHLPFDCADTMELIHSHIARQPTPPHQLLATHAHQPVLEALTHIILKLMAKNAEDRYQSAYGLQADLEFCLRLLDADTPSLFFIPGQQDFSDLLTIPQKLYGRETERDTLLAAFDRVCMGKQELILVAGMAGIGKSALIQEIHKPVTRQRGYFINGKFDQFQRDIPYAALIQALQMLIRHILTENATELAAWREKLLATLGMNGQVIVDIIPELALIIGPQPELPQTGTRESQNRFTLVLQQFVQLFSHTNHPLVIFIDDMQWADQGSLDLLHTLLTAANTMQAASALLIIGAYRDTDVDGGHPLRLLVQQLQTSALPISELHLKPLDSGSVNQLVAETLNRQPDDTLPLTEILIAKTDGNPFFLAEFLKSLYRAGLLQFNYEQHYWEYPLAEIQTQQITDNVVDLMTSRIQQLAPDTQGLLKRAACLGSSFDLSTLALAAEELPTTAARLLDEALGMGLVIPLNDAYRLMTLDIPGLAEQVQVGYAFAHDRIQQAVYHLIAIPERQAIHAYIGALLLEREKTKGHAPQTKHFTEYGISNEHLFDIVYHLNEGGAQTLARVALEELAMLNLLAGKKAKATAAYAPAHHYLHTALVHITCTASGKGDAMVQLCWQDNYPLALAIATEAAEAAYLIGDFAETEQLTTVVQQQASSLLDTMKSYEITLLALMAQNRHQAAITTGLHVLNLLGVPLPAQPDPSHFVQGMEEVATALGDKPIEALLELPPMHDPAMLAAIRILVGITSPAYLTDPQLAGLITLKQVALSLTYGNAPASAFAYAMYGLILCGILGDIETGYRYGNLALELAQQPTHREFRASATHVANAGVRHWKDPLRDTIPSLLHAYQSGLEIGDLQYAASAAYMHMVNSFLVGINLHQLAEEKASFSRMLKQLKQEAALTYHELYRQVILNLVGATGAGAGGNDSPWMLVGDAYDETTMLPVHQQANDITALHLLYSHKMLLCYMFARYNEAYEYAPQAEATIAGVTASTQVPWFYFFDSLVRLARLAMMQQHPDDNDQQQEQDKIAANQEKLQRWATHAPANHHHRWLLVEAERCHLAGDAGMAWQHYQQAQKHAHQYGPIQEEALIHERTGLFYLTQAQPEIAALAIRKAHYLYQRWGAYALTKALGKRYEHLIITDNGEHIINEPKRTTVQLANTRVTTDQHDHTITRTLDFGSIFKASQALSSEIMLETLLARLMDMMLENAGAEQGSLLLEKAGQWVIEAQADTTTHTRVLQAQPVETADVPHTIINYVTHTRESVVLVNAASEGQFTQDSYVIRHQARSILCTPLLYQGRLTAILYLENNQTSGAFTRQRLEVLNMLYGQVAISLENARLYAEMQANERKYRRLFEESKDAIFITTTDGQLIDINPAGLTLFGYTPDEAHQLSLPNHYVDPDDYSRIGQAIAEQGSLRDYEIRMHRKDGSMMECLMTVSLRQDDDGSPATLHGMLRDVTERKRAEQERLKLTAIQRELAMAHHIQQSLLPPATPTWHYPDVQCYTHPAREVGGDLYAYFPTNAESLPSQGAQPTYIVAVGDVTGKGMPAALLMAVSMALFRSLAEHRFAPAEFLTRMDKILVSHTHTVQQNCALVYMDIALPNTANPGPVTVRLANAGCVAPILKRSNGEVSWVEVSGLPLGIPMSHKLPYNEYTLSLQPGDMIILTSDGVIEANSPTTEMFGFERLEQAVQTGPQTSAAAMLDHLRRLVKTFVGEQDPHDDITIVVVQV